MLVLPSAAKKSTYGQILLCMDLYLFQLGLDILTLLGSISTFIKQMRIGYGCSFRCSKYMKKAYRCVLCITLC